MAQGAVASLLIHGDASFSALGIVAECLQLSNVPGHASVHTVQIWPSHRLLHAQGLSDDTIECLNPIPFKELARGH